MLLHPASESKVVMTELDRFLNIFAGSFSAYGQTRKTDEFDDRGKHKTKSFIIKNTVSFLFFGLCRFFGKIVKKLIFWELFSLTQLCKLGKMTYGYKCNVGECAYYLQFQYNCFTDCYIRKELTIKERRTLKILKSNHSDYIFVKGGVNWEVVYTEVWPQ